MTRLPKDLSHQVQTALREDVGTGDVTASLVPAEQQARGRVVVTRSGGDLWQAVGDRSVPAARPVDPSSRWHVTMASSVPRVDTMFEIAGPARPCSRASARR